MKPAVISGGNGGLGRALTAGLQAQGWRVVAMDIATAGLAAGAALNSLMGPAQGRGAQRPAPAAFRSSVIVARVVICAAAVRNSITAAFPD